MQTLDYNIVIGFLVSYVIQWIKRQAWFPWITDQTTKLNFWLSGFLALVVSIGIGYEFNSEAGVLTLTGLTVANVSTHIWAWIQQWLSQQVAYDLVVQPAGRRAAAPKSGGAA